MKRRVVAAAALGSLAVAVGGGAAVLLDPLTSRMVKACEAALKDTLLAPATYRRVSASESTDPISLEEYAAARGETAVAEFDRQRYDHAFRSTVRLDYDAANAFGTPLRLSSLCTYDTLDGDASRAHERLVRIDGKTRTDRLIEAVQTQ